MKLLCDCGNDLGETIKFKLSDFELDEFPVCPKCGKKWYVYMLAREHVE